MFRKFRCGCVAFCTPNKDGRYLVVDPCDRDGPYMRIFFRDLVDPGDGEPLTDEETNRIIKQISSQLQDGEKFAKLQIILEIV